MNDLQEIIVNFELHDVDGIRTCFEKGVNPNELLNGKPLIESLINMYTRGPIFKECVKTFVDFGLVFEDKILLAVLLDDAPSLDSLLSLN